MKDRLPVAFTVCAIAALVPLWGVKYPPMVDLPQHAAQVFVWQHFDDPAFRFPEVYELNYFTPYLLGYLLTRVFAQGMPVLYALKVVLSLTVIALPAAMAWLLGRAGADRWWSLLGFPLAYGFSFHWGFFNFLVAIPVGLAFLAVSGLLKRPPDVRRGVVLALFAAVLFFCHALVFALCLAVLGAVALAAGGGWTIVSRRLLPLLPPAVLAALWVLLLQGGDSPLAVENLWAEPPWIRLRDLPALLVGSQQSGGPWTVGGLVVLLLPWLGGRPEGSVWRRLVPAGVALATYLLLPNRLLNTWFVYPRMAVFVPLLLVLATAPRPRWRGTRAVLVSFVVLWLAFLSLHFVVVDRDARLVDPVLERMEPGRRVLGLSFDRGDAYATGLPVFGHFQSWYQATKGGFSEYSFAIYFQNLVRYRRDSGPSAYPELFLRPDLFDWRRDGGFDYFLVRADRDLGDFLFRDAPVPPELVVRSGRWWLYQRRDP